MSSSQKAKLLTSLMAMLFVLFADYLPIKNTANQSSDSQAHEVQVSDAHITNTQISDTQRLQVVFVRAVDGDTIVVRINESHSTSTSSTTSSAISPIKDSQEKVRLIGINAPESVDPRKTVECFGKEASAEMARLVTRGQPLTLVLDSSQQQRDKYGRLLAYVYVDTLFLNKHMIENGYAYEYTYDKPYAYQKEFKKAEAQARNEKRGLWGDVCTSSPE